MKQVDTKKLVLGCLVIMILMILYTKVTTNVEQAKQQAEIEAAEAAAEHPDSLLLSDRLIGLSETQTGEEESDREEEAEEDDEILGPAEPMDLKIARKEPYGLVVELDYVSADRITLHGSFGYMAISLETGPDGVPAASIERAVTLEELGGIKMGGAAYTDVLGGNGCALIVPGIHNEEIARRRKFLYIEETNEITGGIVAPEWMMEKMSVHDYSDAVVEETLTDTLKTQIEALAKNGGRSSRLLYGPVVIPEYNSNIYGFLAEDGECLEDVWYGLWNRDQGTVARIPLFTEER